VASWIVRYKLKDLNNPATSKWKTIIVSASSPINIQVFGTNDKLFALR